MLLEMLLLLLLILLLLLLLLVLMSLLLLILLLLLMMLLMLMLQVSADVLTALKKWATPEGAAELLQRPGTLTSMASFANDPDKAKDNALMAHVAMAHETDDQVVKMLQDACSLGVEHWIKHTGFGLDKEEARAVSMQDELCAGSAPANNDACERVIASVRYWSTRAPRMRRAGVEAQIMAKQNDPFQSLAAGRLGNQDDVLEFARRESLKAMQQQGTRVDEVERIAKEQKHYQDLCAPKPSQGPAAATRRENVVAAAAAAADVEGNLMFADKEVLGMSTKELQALKRGRIAVGQVAFSNGAVWQAVFTKDGEGSGKPNAQGKRGVVKEDYVADLLAAMKSYSEVMQESGQPETCAPVAAPGAEPTADPVPTLVVAPAPAPTVDPAPATVAGPAPTPTAALAPAPATMRDPNKRPSKRPLQYDPLRDGASDQIRLGVAKPKKPKKRSRTQH